MHKEGTMSLLSRGLRELNGKSAGGQSCPQAARTEDLPSTGTGLTGDSGNGKGPLESSSGPWEARLLLGRGQVPWPPGSTACTRGRSQPPRKCDRENCLLPGPQPPPLRGFAKAPLGPAPLTGSDGSSPGSLLRRPRVQGVSTTLRIRSSLAPDRMPRRKDTVLSEP